jgi:hypothetical protein
VLQRSSNECQELQCRPLAYGPNVAHLCFAAFPPSPLAPVRRIPAAIRGLACLLASAARFLKGALAAPRPAVTLRCGAQVPSGAQHLYLLPLRRELEVLRQSAQGGGRGRCAGPRSLPTVDWQVLKRP